MIPSIQKQKDGKEGQEPLLFFEQDAATSTNMRKHSSSSFAPVVFLLALGCLAHCQAIMDVDTDEPSIRTGYDHPMAHQRKGGFASVDDPPVPPFQPFALEAVFGDNMVLQHGDQAAVYGFLGPLCVDVQVALFASTQDTDRLVHVARHARINATQQPFGPAWGARPCRKEDCPPSDMDPFNPWNEPLPTWKMLLPPQKPGGNYTIQATCLLAKDSPEAAAAERAFQQPHTSASSFRRRTTNTLTTRTASNDKVSVVDDPDNLLLPISTVTITNVTFGDVWYCSGQSNMQLPLYFTFHKNETARDIVEKGKYRNLRLMAGNSGNVPHGRGQWQPQSYGATGGSNAWMTALQATLTDDTFRNQIHRLFSFGAACWYFGQALSELGVADLPIGLVNTAIGGQRIQEYMDNSTIHQCQNRSATATQNSQLYWEGQLFGSQVLPFADMTLKGWIWYQGENNMHDLKGNSKQNLGYGCEMKLMIQQWRKLWSQVPGTTRPDAPFGIVSLASSGSEGGPDMGAMHYAQTANYGVLPHEGDLPNTFIAQAYDLDDEWGPEMGPCFDQKCCQVYKHHYDPKVCTNETLRKICNGPNGGCTVDMENPFFMGGIHPRSKRQVGERLAAAAYNLFYGGTEGFTGPTLAGCSLVETGDGLEGNQQVLEIRFDKTLLRGDKLAEPVFPPAIIKPRYHQPAGGSQLWVQTNASLFCMESTIIHDIIPVDEKHTQTHYYCPAWAGGNKEQQENPVDAPYKDGWILLNFTLAAQTTNAIHVDLRPLNGSLPTAVRYAWDLVDCCDRTDPTLYVTHGCIASCPIMGLKSQLPANPFQARIVHGKCQCVDPQVCNG